MFEFMQPSSNYIMTSFPVGMAFWDTWGIYTILKYICIFYRTTYTHLSDILLPDFYTSEHLGQELKQASSIPYLGNIIYGTWKVIWRVNQIVASEKYGYTELQAEA